MLFPFAGCGTLVCGGPFLVLQFRASLDVENRTSESLRVTPLGTAHGSRRLTALPVYFGPYWNLRTADFEVAPGETLHLVYDCDDVDVAGLLVRDGHGGSRMAPVEDTGGVAQESYAFVIDDVARMDEASSGAVEAAERRWGGATYWIVASAGAVCIVAFLALSCVGLRVVVRGLIRQSMG